MPVPYRIIKEIQILQGLRPIGFQRAQSAFRMPMAAGRLQGDQDRPEVVSNPTILRSGAYGFQNASGE